MGVVMVWPFNDTPIPGTDSRIGIAEYISSLGWFSNVVSTPVANQHHTFLSPGFLDSLTSARR